MARIRPNSAKTLLAAVLVTSLAEPVAGQTLTTAPASPEVVPAAPPVPAQQPRSLLSVRIDQSEPLRLLTATADRSGVPWSVFLPPLITGVVTLAGTSLALFFGFRSTRKTIEAAARNSEITVWQKANEIEVKDLQNQLDGFYGRFQQLSQVNTLLSRELRSRQSSPETFFLLEKLFDREWLNSLSQGDKTLGAYIHP